MKKASADATLQMFKEFLETSNIMGYRLWSSTSCVQTSHWSACKGWYTLVSDQNLSNAKSKKRTTWPSAQREQLGTPKLQLVQLGVRKPRLVQPGMLTRNLHPQLAQVAKPVLLGIVSFFNLIWTSQNLHNSGSKVVNVTIFSSPFWGISRAQKSKFHMPYPITSNVYHIEEILWLHFWQVCQVGAVKLKNASICHVKCDKFAKFVNQPWLGMWLSRCVDCRYLSYDIPMAKIRKNSSSKQWRKYASIQNSLSTRMFRHLFGHALQSRTSHPMKEVVTSRNQAEDQRCYEKSWKYQEATLLIEIQACSYVDFNSLLRMAQDECEAISHD